MFDQNQDCHPSSTARAKQLAALFSRQLTRCSLVPPQVVAVNGIELVNYRLAEAVERVGVYESAVGHERHYAAFGMALNPVGRQANRPDVWVVQRHFLAGRSFGVSLSYPSVNARIRPVVHRRPRRVADDDLDGQIFLPLDARAVRPEQGVVHRSAALIRLEGVRQDSAAERLAVHNTRRVSVRRLYVHRRYPVRQRHNLVGVNLAIRVLAPQGVLSDDSALNHAGYERPRPRERVYDMDAFVSERRSELRVEDVFNASDYVIHRVHRRIDDAQIPRRVGQGVRQESVVQLGDYPLLARRSRYAFRSDADVAVEPLKPLGFLFQSAVLERVYHALHGERDGVALREIVAIEQRVEHGLGHQMLGEHPNRLVFGHAVIQVASQASEESVELRADAGAGRRQQSADARLVALGNLAHGVRPPLPVARVGVFVHYCG